MAESGAVLPKSKSIAGSVRVNLSGREVRVVVILPHQSVAGE